MNKVKKKTIKGLKWNAVGSVLQQGSTLVFGIVLARLLPPNAFGLIAMLMVFIGFARVLNNAGFAQALIQRKDLSESHKHSMFWFNVALGLLMFFIFFLLAPAISRFYEEPRLIKLLWLLALQFPLLSSHLVHRALLQKTLNFRAIVVANVSAAVTTGVVGSILAINGLGVWSLAWGRMSGVLIKICLIWTFSSYWPKLLFSKKSIAELFAFGAYSLGNQSLFYWTKKVDDVLIGKILGAGSLGIYSKAFSFLMKPISATKKQMGSVLFPSFSLIQDDLRNMRSGYIKATQILQFILTPIMLGLFVVSEHFVLSVLGQRWAEMVGPLQVFCFAALASALGFPGEVLKARNKVKLQFKVNLIVQSVYIILIFIGVYQFGLMGAVYGVLIGMFLRSTVLNTIALKEIELTWAKLLQEIAPFTFPAFLMCAVLWLVYFYFPVDVKSIGSLILRITIGGLLFGGFSYILLKKRIPAMVKDFKN